MNQQWQTKSVIWHLTIPRFLTKETCMADAPRITVDEPIKRMEAGEDFVFIDTRNPQAWAESNSMLPGALRITPDQVEASLSRIPKDKPVVAYCT
jgi:rhodanese-related sulfurtransferase